MERRIEHIGFAVAMLLCLVLQANAQTGSNTMVNDHNSWAVLWRGVCPSPCPLVGTDYIYFDGDSMVAGYSYKKVFSCDDESHENIEYKGLMREQDKKTYIIPVHSEIEYLLYDFSLEEGTIFEFYAYSFQETLWLEVKSSDTIEINGVLKKRLQLAYPSSIYKDDDYMIDTWIEGIGSLHGILYPCYRLGLVGRKDILLCYYQNNELSYKNPAYSKCYYDNLADLLPVQEIEVDGCHVYPNPVEGVLNISCLNNAISRIEIFDNSGRQVYSRTCKDTIDVSSFARGLYILKAYGTNGEVSVFKIVKK